MLLIFHVYYQAPRSGRCSFPLILTTAARPSEIIWHYWNQPPFVNRITRVKLFSFPDLHDSCFFFWPGWLQRLERILNVRLCSKHFIISFVVDIFCFFYLNDIIETNANVSPNNVKMYFHLKIEMFQKTLLQNQKPRKFKKGIQK